VNDFVQLKLQLFTSSRDIFFHFTSGSLNGESLKLGNLFRSLLDARERTPAISVVIIYGTFTCCFFLLWRLFNERVFASCNSES